MRTTWRIKLSNARYWVNVWGDEYEAFRFAGSCVIYSAHDIASMLLDGWSGRRPR